MGGGGQQAGQARLASPPACGLRLRSDRIGDPSSHTSTPANEKTDRLRTPCSWRRRDHNIVYCAAKSRARGEVSSRDLSTRDHVHGCEKGRAAVLRGGGERLVDGYDGTSPPIHPCCFLRLFPEETFLQRCGKTGSELRLISGSREAAANGRACAPQSNPHPSDWHRLPLRSVLGPLPSFLTLPQSRFSSPSRGFVPAGHVLYSVGEPPYENTGAP